MMPPATWYPDPSGRHEHRYWDGERWTEHVADAGIAAIDPFEAVTADDAVNGALAADIASIAMATTTMANDPPERMRKDLFRREQADEPTGPRTSDEEQRHDSGDDTDSGSADQRAEHERPRAGHDDQRAEHERPPAWHDDPDAGAVGELHGHMRADDDQVAEDPVTEDQVAEDPWAAAAAGYFVMPADTAADLTRGAAHVSAEPPAETVEADDVDDETASEPAGPGFVLPGDTCDVSGTEGRVSIHGAAVTVLLDHDRGIVGVVDALRRTEGACDLDPTDRAWLRRITGDGSVTLVGETDVVLVTVTGGCDVVAAVEPLVATDDTTVLDPVAVKGEEPDSYLALAAPGWLALAPTDAPRIVEVTPDDDVTVDRRQLLAWTDGVVVTGTRKGLRCGGTGQLLVTGEL